MEIEVTFYNSHQEIIGKYKSDGKGVGFVAMYWGYGEEAWRKSSINAFKNGIEMIKDQIQADSKKLNEKLYE